MSTLRSEPLRSLLDRLHNEAKGDRLRYLGLIPRFVSGIARGRKLFEIITPEAMRGCFIPVSREQGEFLYLVARALGASTIVEFGTSFAISTLYLAAAVRDNGGGQVIGSEIERSKWERARAHLNEGGLDDCVDVRLGDALETLKNVPEPIDLVLLDGWKDLYLPVLELLKPRMRAGAVVLADNIFTFRSSLRPYVEFVQSGEHGFESTTLSLADGFEYSVRVA